MNTGSIIIAVAGSLAIIGATLYLYDGGNSAIKSVDELGAGVWDIEDKLSRASSVSSIDSETARAVEAYGRDSNVSDEEPVPIMNIEDFDENQAGGKKKRKSRRRKNKSHKKTRKSKSRRTKK